eukprot:1145176-Pelagomonas_calceolata.AAC.9
MSLHAAESHGEHFAVQGNARALWPWDCMCKTPSAGSLIQMFELSHLLCSSEHAYVAPVCAPLHPCVQLALNLGATGPGQGGLFKGQGSGRYNQTELQCKSGAVNTLKHPEFPCLFACPARRVLGYELRLRRNWRTGRYATHSLREHTGNVECLELVDTAVFGRTLVVDIAAFGRTLVTMLAKRLLEWKQKSSCSSGVEILELAFAAGSGSKSGHRLSDAGGKGMGRSVEMK